MYKQAKRAKPQVMVQDNNKVVDFRRRESNEQVLERLFNEHGAALRAFLRGRMGPSDELEDVVQEVFVRLARMDDLHNRLAAGRKGSRAFIYTTANHLLVDMERRKAVRRSYQQTQSDAAEETRFDLTPEVIVQGMQKMAIVERAILSLPPVWRQAFVLSRFEHLNYQEIADHMGVSSRSVEKYIGHALVKIRTAVTRAEEI